MWALLALYQALRIAITDAIATVPGTDPDRASYQIAVQSARILATGGVKKITSVTTAISQYQAERKTRRRRSLTPAPGP